MRRQELDALKLQMGISLSARIEPGVLLAMWQQLKRECNGTQPHRPQPAPAPHRMTFTPFDV